jgi:hypothetical protein
MDVEFVGPRSQQNGGRLGSLSWANSWATARPATQSFGRRSFSTSMVSRSKTRGLGKGGGQPKLLDNKKRSITLKVTLTDSLSLVSQSAAASNNCVIMPFKSVLASNVLNCPPQPHHWCCPSNEPTVASRPTSKPLLRYFHVALEQCARMFMLLKVGWAGNRATLDATAFITSNTRNCRSKCTECRKPGRSARGCQASHYMTWSTGVEQQSIKH